MKTIQFPERAMRTGRLTTYEQKKNDEAPRQNKARPRGRVAMVK